RRGGLLQGDDADALEGSEPRLDAGLVERSPELARVLGALLELGRERSGAFDRLPLLEGRGGGVVILQAGEGRAGRAAQLLFFFPRHVARGEGRPRDAEGELEGAGERVVLALEVLLRPRERVDSPRGDLGGAPLRE